MDFIARHLTPELIAGIAIPSSVWILSRLQKFLSDRVPSEIRSIVSEVFDLTDAVTIIAKSRGVSLPSTKLAQTVVESFFSGSFDPKQIEAIAQWVADHLSQKILAEKQIPEYTMNRADGLAKKLSSPDA